MQANLSADRNITYHLDSTLATSRSRLSTARDLPTILRIARVLRSSRLDDDKQSIEWNCAYQVVAAALVSRFSNPSLLIDKHGFPSK